MARQHTACHHSALTFIPRVLASAVRKVGCVVCNLRRLVRTFVAMRPRHRCTTDSRRTQRTTVVAGHNDERVVPLAAALESGRDISHAVVQLGHHCALHLRAAAFYLSSDGHDIPRAARLPTAAVPCTCRFPHWGKGPPCRTAPGCLRRGQSRTPDARSVPCRTAR